MAQPWRHRKISKPLSFTVLVLVCICGQAQPLGAKPGAGAAAAATGYSMPGQAEA